MYGNHKNANHSFKMFNIQFLFKKVGHSSKVGFKQLQLLCDVIKYLFSSTQII